jgi:hypothetical protein
MQRKRKNKGQLKISFGMIFSIILIIVFLAFGFYAIKTFLGFQDQAKLEKFSDDLQSDVDRVWRSSESSENKEYSIASGVDFVCFIDSDSDAAGENSVLYSELKYATPRGENLVFYPVETSEAGSSEIKYIDIEKTTAEENPFCLEVRNQKISLILQKEFDEDLVTITKQE